MSNVTDFFTKCNMKRYCEMTIGEGETKLVLPFCFDISKVYMTYTNEENFLCDFRGDLKIKKIRNNLADFLEDVELELFSFESEGDIEFIDELKDEGIKLYLENKEYHLESKEDLYKLLNILSYSDVEFAKINKFVIDNRSELVAKFINMVSDALMIEDKTGKVTEAYMTMRGAMEHSSACIFPENIGKAVSQYSWRENMVKRLYLARKVEVEEFYTEKAKAEAKRNK